MLKNKLFLSLGLLSMALTLVISGMPSKVFADTDIASASITGFLAPVTSATPQLAATLSAGATTYTITSLTWSGNPATFAPATAYTATVVLTSATGYIFPVGGLTPTVNLGTASAGVVNGGDVSGNTLTFTNLFPATNTAIVPTTSITGNNDGSGDNAQVNNNGGDNNTEVNNNNGDDNNTEGNNNGKGDNNSENSRAMTSINETIPGCDGRTTGFSSLTGLSCIGNVVTSPTAVTSPASIPGCDARTTGFSITTGVSCVGNVVSATATTNNLYNFGNTTLGDGSRGEAVKELQKFLNNKLNLGLSIDGILGAHTISIVEDWQKSHGLTADGLIGAKTKGIMETEAESGN